MVEKIFFKFVFYSVVIGQILFLILCAIFSGYIRVQLMIYLY